MIFQFQRDQNRPKHYQNGPQKLQNTKIGQNTTKMGLKKIENYIFLVLEIFFSNLHINVKNLTKLGLVMFDRFSSHFDPYISIWKILVKMKFGSKNRFFQHFHENI